MASQQLVSEVVYNENHSCGSKTSTWQWDASGCTTSDYWQVWVDFSESIGVPLGSRIDQGTASASGLSGVPTLGVPHTMTVYERFLSNETYYSNTVTLSTSTPTAISVSVPSSSIWDGVTPASMFRTSIRNKETFYSSPVAVSALSYTITYTTPSAKNLFVGAPT